MLAAGNSRVNRVPPLDRGLAELPAKKDRLPAALVKEVDQADAGVSQHDAPFLELAQVFIQRLGQVGEVPTGQPAPVVRGLFSHGGQRLILGERLLRVADALQQGLELGQERVCLFDAVELFGHQATSSGGDRGHRAQPGHHVGQALENEIDVGIDVVLTNR